MYTCRDVFFMVNSIDADHRQLTYPHVIRAFPYLTGTEDPSVSTKVDIPAMVKNAHLYSLGKLLIQLIDCQPLLAPEWTSDRATSSDYDPEQMPALVREPLILRKKGRMWADVVRRCLYCEFDTATADARLDNDAFFAKAYTAVLKPLAAALAALDAVE